MTSPVSLISESAAIAESSFERPLIVAHRARARGVPENSLAGIRANREIGTDLVEIDVRRSLDGVAFVIHDWYLARTVHGHGHMRLTPSHILARLRLRNGRGETLPTLAMALQMIAEHEQGPGPALHVKDQGALRAALAVVNEYDLAGRTWLWLHGVRAAELARKLAPAARITMLEARQRTPDDWAAHLRTAQSAGADGISMPWSALTPNILDQANSAGLKTFAVNHDPSQIAPMVRAGLTGIISDDPEETHERMRAMSHEP